MRKSCGVFVEPVGLLIFVLQFRVVFDKIVVGRTKMPSIKKRKWVYIMSVKAIMDKAARDAILANYKTLCRLVGIPDLTLEESLAELLRVSLFEKQPITNPILLFRNREKNGDFEPLRSDEEASNLRPGREPMDDATFEDAKQAVFARSRFWDGASSAKPFEVLSRAIMTMEPGEVYYVRRSGSVYHSDDDVTE